MRVGPAPQPGTPSCSSPSSPRHSRARAEVCGEGVRECARRERACLGRPWTRQPQPRRAFALPRGSLLRARAGRETQGRGPPKSPPAIALPPALTRACARTSRARFEIVETGEQERVETALKLLRRRQAKQLRKQ